MKDITRIMDSRTINRKVSLSVDEVQDILDNHLKLRGSVDFHWHSWNDCVLDVEISATLTETAPEVVQEESPDTASKT